LVYPALPCGLLACDANVSWAAAARAGVWTWLLEGMVRRWKKSGNTLDPVALVNHYGAMLFATTFSKKLNLVRMEILTKPGLSMFLMQIWK